MFEEKKYTVISTEKLQYLLGSFSSQEEYVEFADEFRSMIKLILQTGEEAYLKDTDEGYMISGLQQLFILTRFIKSNIECIKELIQRIDCKYITESQKTMLDSGHLTIEDLWAS